VLNYTFSNISAVSWRPVLVVEEAGVSGENYRLGQTTGKLYHLRKRNTMDYVVEEAGVPGENHRL